jgi:hypothetical protein
VKSTIQGTIISDFKVDTSMVFVDLSLYNDLLPITEPTLSVIPPYSENPIQLFYNAKGNTVITSITLDRSDKLEHIPCGLYKFTQSICPNDKLKYSFWYVHLGLVKQKIAKLYCEGNVKDAHDLSDKVDALEALSYCMSEDAEKRILAILDTLNCVEEKCVNKQPMKKFMDMPVKCGNKKCGDTCKGGCKGGCKTCNK